IYICASIKSDPASRRNLLYINQGLNADSIPVFREMAEAYNLADTGLSVHAAFFDYDNDGDLDMYLANTQLSGREGVRMFNANNTQVTLIDFDRRLRNDGNGEGGQPVFSDVTNEAGITGSGYALGLVVSDVNKDGWKDIYVANDFFTGD